MTAKKAGEAAGAQKAPATFSKSQILSFKRFAARRDLLRVKLDDARSYSMDQVEAVIREFMTPKGKVR